MTLQKISDININTVLEDDIMKKSEAIEVAKKVSEKLDIDFSFVSFEDDGRLCFQTKKYEAMKIIGLNGDIIRDSFISNKWVRDSTLIYYSTYCYPQQIKNGDLEWMVVNGYTQEQHERFLSE